MLGHSEWTTILLVGLVQAAVTLGVFVWALRERDLGEARNLAFTVLVFGELFRAFAARSAVKAFWRMPALSNASLLVIVVVSGFVQIALHHVPWTQQLFDLDEISASDCALSVLLGLIPLAATEALKGFRRFNAHYATRLSSVQR